MPRLLQEKSVHIKRQVYTGDKSAYEYLTGNNYSGKFVRNTIHDGGFEYGGFKVVSITTQKVMVEAWIKPETPTTDGDEYPVWHFHNNGGFTNPTRFGLSLIATNGATNYDIRVYADHLGGPVNTQILYDNNDWQLPPDEWTHIVVCYEADKIGAEFSLFVNGELQEDDYADPNGTGMPVGLNNAQFHVAKAESTGSPSYGGFIDEVRVWNIRRTEDEITLWKNEELLGFETGLVSYHKFENSGDGLEVHFDFEQNETPFLGTSLLKGHFRVLNEEQASINGLQYGQAHSLALPVDTDVREGDIVIIDDQEFTVRGVANHKHGSALDYMRILVVKPEKT